MTNNLSAIHVAFTAALARALDGFQSAEPNEGDIAELHVDMELSPLDIWHPDEGVMREKILPAVGALAEKIKKIGARAYFHRLEMSGNCARYGFRGVLVHCYRSYLPSRDVMVTRFTVAVSA